MNLVIGATGILGSHVLLRLLQCGLPVIACKQKTSDTEKVKRLFSYYDSNFSQLFENIKWVEVDVIDIYSIEEALEGVTTVYNCSGFVSFDKKDRQKLFIVNEIGTANIVNACLQKKIDALCHVSSIATINNLDYTLPLNETIFWKFSGKESDYAVSKYNAEREVWRGIEEGLNAVIVNPGIILSSGFWNQSSSKLFEVCYGGNKFYTQGMASYVAAQDVAIAMLNLIEKRTFANRFILIENNYSFKKILDEIHTHLKKPLPSIKANKAMLEMASVLDAFICAVSNKERRITKPLIYAALNNQLFSNTKIKETININFTPVKLAIEKICSDFLIDKNNES